jgi:hypothetical protein
LRVTSRGLGDVYKRQETHSLEQYLLELSEIKAA